MGIGGTQGLSGHLDWGVSLAAWNSHLIVHSFVLQADCFGRQSRSHDAIFNHKLSISRNVFNSL